MRHLAKPLAGRRIVITRPRAQAASLAARLDTLGAEVIICPAIAIVQCENPALDNALRHFTSYDRVIFTSANAARVLVTQLHRVGWPDRMPRTMAIGPETAAVLANAGIACDALPPHACAGSLVMALGAIAGERLLMPRSDLADDTLPQSCRHAGAVVDAPVAYRTVRDPALGALAPMIAAGGIDAITLASGSAARAVAAAIGPGHALSPRTSRPMLCCIGPATAAAARDTGLPVEVTAPVHTADGIADALVGWFARDPVERSMQ